MFSTTNTKPAETLNFSILQSIVNIFSYFIFNGIPNTIIFKPSNNLHSTKTFECNKYQTSGNFKSFEFGNCIGKEWFLFDLWPWAKKGCRGKDFLRWNWRWSKHCLWSTSCPTKVAWGPNQKIPGRSQRTDWCDRFHTTEI